MATTTTTAPLTRQEERLVLTLNEHLTAQQVQHKHQLMLRLYDLSLLSGTRGTYDLTAEEAATARTATTARALLYLATSDLATWDELKAWQDTLAAHRA